jgi:two-component system chemotaxis response regulator CheB
MKRDARPRLEPPAASRPVIRLVAVGASAGGTEALPRFLTALPADCPAVVLVQHMPEAFIRPFAERLDALCEVEVVTAEDDQPLEPGRVCLAPGDRHLRVARAGAAWICRVTHDAPVNRHRPSVDVLFESCARLAGSAAIGVLMTGMGEDGARGLLAMRRVGARTLAQDDATSLVFGMARTAAELGAVEHLLPLDRLAPAALAMIQGRPWAHPDR